MHLTSFIVDTIQLKRNAQDCVLDERHTRANCVISARAKEQRAGGACGRGPARGAPHPVGEHWIHPSAEEERICCISNKLDALGHRARHDRGCGHSKLRNNTPCCQRPFLYAQSVLIYASCTTCSPAFIAKQMILLGMLAPWLIHGDLGTSIFWAGHRTVGMELTVRLGTEDLPHTGSRMSQSWCPA